MNVELPNWSLNSRSNTQFLFLFVINVAFDTKKISRFFVCNSFDIILAALSFSIVSFTVSFENYYFFFLRIYCSRVLSHHCENCVSLLVEFCSLWICRFIVILLMHFLCASLLVYGCIHIYLFLLYTRDHISFFAHWSTWFGFCRHLPFDIAFYLTGPALLVDVPRDKNLTGILT